MIGRGPLRVSHVLAVGALTVGFVWAGFATHPAAAVASAGAPVQIARVARHTIDFDWNGQETQEETDAATVGDFLRERNVLVGDADYVDPASGVPITDGMVVIYRAAVPVTIQTPAQSITVQSSADTVATLLQQENVTLGAHDEVQPALAAAVPAGGTVRIVHVVEWQRTLHHAIRPNVVHRIDFDLAPGAVRLVSRGAAGVREEIVRFAQRDGGPIDATVVSSRVVRKPRARVIAEGVDQLSALSRFEDSSAFRSLMVARRALQMVATAYTADCSGCSGITAIGRPAGRGIVAVDPSVIPLGTRLFIPGYGLAVAGDTGGAIRGYRIDLGFNTERDAMLFGRREITVYRLK